MVVARKEGSLGYKYGKADLVRMGIFSEEAYISKSEPYKDKVTESLDSRRKGKQFATAPRRKDALFEKHYVRLFEGEPEKPEQTEKVKNITEKPFKPASVATRPGRSKGCHWGTIEQQFPLPPSDFKIPKPKPEVVVKKEKELKNFVTSPGKKGSGYGYPDIAFTKIKYESDPYDSLQKSEKKEREAAKKLLITQKRFVTATSGNSYFNPFSRLPIDQKTEKKVVEKMVPFKPFYGHTLPINPYPKTDSSPKDKEVKTTPEKKESKIFRPPGVTGSYPIASVVEKNVPIAPPVWLRETLKNGMAN